MTVTGRIWTNPRNQPKTVPQDFGLVACIDIAGRLLVIVEGPRPAEGASYRAEIQADSPDGTLAGQLIESTADLNGWILIGEFDSPPDPLIMIPIILRIDDVEVLRVEALLSRKLS